METSKPKFGTIDQIKDAQAKQRKQLEDLRKKQWNDLSTGTDEIQIINSQNIADAKQGLVDLDHELTGAYGLKPGGYWNKVKELDDEVHSYVPKATSQSTEHPQTTTSFAAPKNNFEADDWVMRGIQPPKVKPVGSVKPYDPSGTKPIKYYNLDEDEKQKLRVEENVFAWQQQNPQATEEDYAAKKRSFDEQINYAADDYLNSYGGMDDEETKDAWVEYGKTIDELAVQRDAYNRALMRVET